MQANKTTKRRHESGFTLVELLVVMAIAAIFLSLAVPAFGEFLSNSRLSNAITRLTTDLQLAKTEAIKRNSRVLMCPSSNGASCGSGTNWQVGWLLCYDRDNNATCDASTPELPNPIRAAGALRNLTLSGPSSSFWFTPAGSITSSTGGVMNFTFNPGTRKLAVQPSGSIGRL